MAATLHISFFPEGSYTMIREMIAKTVFDLRVWDIRYGLNIQQSIDDLLNEIDATQSMQEAPSIYSIRMQLIAFYELWTEIIYFCIGRFLFPIVNLHLRLPEVVINQLVSALRLMEDQMYTFRSNLDDPSTSIGNVYEQIVVLKTAVVTVVGHQHCDLLYRKFSHVIEFLLHEYHHDHESGYRSFDAYLRGDQGIIQEPNTQPKIAELLKSVNIALAKNLLGHDHNKAGDDQQYYYVEVPSGRFVLACFLGLLMVLWTTYKVLRMVCICGKRNSTGTSTSSTTGENDEACDERKRVNAIRIDGIHHPSHLVNHPNHAMVVRSSGGFHIKPLRSHTWNPARSMFEYTETHVHSAPLSIANFFENQLGMPWVGSAIRVIDIDAPFCMILSLLCWLVHVYATDNQKTKYFTMPPLSWFRKDQFLSYWRFVGQNFGHGDRNHVVMNLSNFLLVGPVCEREFGAWNMLKMFLWVSLMSGLTHMYFGHPQGGQMGCSGFVFGTLVLNSLIQVKYGRVPLTFLVQMVIWWPKPYELRHALFGQGMDSTSQFAHATGAIIGAIFGYHFHHEKVHVTMGKIADVWWRNAQISQQQREQMLSNSGTIGGTDNGGIWEGED